MKAATRLRQHLANDFDVTERGTRIDIDTHRHTINVEVYREGRPVTQILDLTVEQFANILVSGDSDRHQTSHQEAIDALESALAIRTAERDQLAEKLERMRKKGKTLVEVFGNESKS